MRKTFALVALALLCSKTFSQGFHYGIGAGLNYNTLIIQRFLDIESKYNVGFNVSVIAEYNFNKSLGLRLQPGIANRGSILKYNAESSEDRVNINYLSFPLLLKYSPCNKLSFLLGPEYSLRLTAMPNSDERDVDMRGIYNRKFDFAINAGVSYLVCDNIELEFRYNRGFFSTTKDIKVVQYYKSSNTNFYKDLGPMRTFIQGFMLSAVYLIK